MGDKYRYFMEGIKDAFGRQVEVGRGRFKGCICETSGSMGGREIYGGFAGCPQVVRRGLGDVEWRCWEVCEMLSEG